jgi:hypothetical protein
MLKRLQSKYDRLSARHGIFCVQAIRTIPSDLHSLTTLKTSGVIPLLPLYAFMAWTVTLSFPYLDYHQSPSSHLSFLRSKPMPSSYIFPCSSHTEILKQFFYFNLTLIRNNYITLQYNFIFIDLVSLKYYFNATNNVTARYLIISILRILLSSRMWHRVV